VKRLCRQSPWLDQAHKELHRIDGTAWSAEATGDLLGGPGVPLFCRGVKLAVELPEVLREEYLATLPSTVSGPGSEAGYRPNQ
jgi:hypothetical protein